MLWVNPADAHEIRGFPEPTQRDGTEAGVGSAGDAQACAALVMANEPTANGATFSNTGGTGCYAEFGMTGANDTAGWQSCMFDGTVGR